MPDIKHFDPDAALETVVRLFWRQGVASTGIQHVVTATGLSRSSIYATFGGKQDLYAAALHRYIDTRSMPAFSSLAADGRGLPAIAAFFSGLIEVRSSGEFAGWGCMAANAHAAAGNTDPKIRAALDEHHQRLRDAFRAALAAAAEQGQLRPGVGIEATAELLALLAYGVNLRSRAGAGPDTLHRTVTAALGWIGHQVA